MIEAGTVHGWPENRIRILVNIGSGNPAITRNGIG